MPFQAGVSGNPKGRPKKARALTEILERAGGKTVKDPSGLSVTGRRFLALRLWELVTTGKATLVDGTEIKAQGDAWFDVVKFIYSQVDGPPKQQIGVDIDFTKLTDAQLIAFITAGIATLGSGNSGSTAPEPETEHGDEYTIH